MIETIAGNILCTDGQWYHPRFVGPGANCARTWKTRAGAEKFAADRWNQGCGHSLTDRPIRVRVIELDECGFDTRERAR